MKRSETAVFAAGCFWGVEELFRTTPGVLATEVGYTGGHTVNPTYEDVCTGKTGHAEAVRLEYDPDAISYAALLKLFFDNHDPTTLNSQGPDHGSQYRSAIFYCSDEQRVAAEQAKEALGKSGRYGVPVVTEIVPAGPFYRAEEYHQQYSLKRGGGVCHM
jgi:peptide-methionine (S)-S-oxide reductase